MSSLSGEALGDNNLSSKKNLNVFNLLSIHLGRVKSYQNV